MSDNAAKVIEMLTKAAVTLTIVAVTAIGGIVWNHHERIGKVESISYTQKDAKDDRTAFLGEIKELRNEMKADWQRIENKLDRLAP